MIGEGGMQKEAGLGHVIEYIQGTSFYLWHLRQETGVLPRLEHMGMVRLLDHVPV